MWLFTRYGFFSTVCDTKHGGLNTNVIMIRARLESHLVALQNHFQELAEYKIEGYRPGNDYNCRIYVPKEIWAKVMAKLTLEIDYGNFKNEVHKQPGLGNYQDLLFDVWNEMFELQE
jgi:hypothetical protein